jgi:hypothetical protein
MKKILNLTLVTLFLTASVAFATDVKDLATQRVQHREARLESFQTQTAALAVVAIDESNTIILDSYVSRLWKIETEIIRLLDRAKKSKADSKSAQLDLVREKTNEYNTLLTEFKQWAASL